MQTKDAVEEPEVIDEVQTPVITKPRKLVKLATCVSCYIPVGFKGFSPARSFDEPRPGMVHLDCLVKRKSYIITVKGKKKPKTKILMGPLRERIERDAAEPVHVVSEEEEAEAVTAVEVMMELKRKAEEEKGIRLVNKNEEEVSD